MATMKPYRQNDVPNQLVIQGLKDHEIAQVVNAIRDELSELIPHQSLRQRISTAMMKKLTELDRRIDAPKTSDT